jgi:DegV family protein with EDD domain
MSVNYQIVVDSTTDLPATMADEMGLVVIPYIVSMDGKEYYNYLDGREISAKDFYNALRAGKQATTTQVTAFRYAEAWEPFLSEGMDVLYMCLSSGLSKSYDQSLIAVAEMKEKYPDRKVISIDTRSASAGQGALAIYAARARDEGKSLEENAAYLEGIIPRVQHWIMADDLHHLKRGGRVSGAAAMIGTMLSVKPLLNIFANGSLAPVAKAKGRKKAMAHIVEQMAAQKVDATNQPLCIAHGDDIELAQMLQSLIVEKFGECEFIINDFGPVIGAHTGPSSLAAVFVGAERQAQAPA